MDPFTFMSHVLDPVDMSRWPLRTIELQDMAHQHMKALLDGKFVLDRRLERGTIEFDAQMYFIRLLRRMISDLERKFCPRIRAISQNGDPDSDMMRRIIKGLEIDSTGNILMHLVYDEFYARYYEEAKKIDYKDQHKIANDLFVKALAGSFEQAVLVLKTEAAKAGIDIHNL